MERLCASIDVPEGEVRKVDTVEGQELAVYRLQGTVYATDNLCTHGDAPLCDGEIDNGQIVCPYHLGTFDIRTGEATGAPCTIPLRTYAVIEQNSAIYLK